MAKSQARKIKWILCLIGYQAGKEGLSYLRISSEFLALFAQEKIFLCPFWPYNIVFIEGRSRFVMLPK